MVSVAAGPEGRALAVLLIAAVAAETLRRFAPDGVAATVVILRADPGDSFLAGTLVTGGAGFTLAVYALSVVGLGVALPAVGAYCLLLGGAAGVGALAVGNVVLEQVGVVGAGSPLSVAVGSGAFALAGAVPVVGLWLVAVVTLAGVGAVTTYHLDGRRA